VNHGNRQAPSMAPPAVTAKAAAHADELRDPAATQATSNTLHSCLYAGSVRHRRFDSVGHEFTVRLYFAYLDLDELDRAFAKRFWWSARRPAPMRFRRRDYFGPPDQPLADCVRDAVAKQLGTRPTGPVRVLTNLRCFGYIFNPVSIYYCFDQHEQLVAVLAEITNIPWGERHHYVVGASSSEQRVLRARFAKQFHVSPFQPMEQEYSWSLSMPGERLAVHMQNHEAGAKIFDATLAVTRRPWNTRNLTAVIWRHPWMTAKVTCMIYWHAFRLWCKRATFHRHPSKRGVA
jgi:uncharacterized protein